MTIRIDVKSFEEFLNGTTPAKELLPIYRALFDVSLLVNQIKLSDELKNTPGIAKYDFVDLWTKLQAVPGMSKEGAYYLILQLEEMHVLLSKTLIADPDKLANIAKQIKALASLKNELRAKEITQLSS